MIRRLLMPIVALATLSSAAACGTSNSADKPPATPPPTSAPLAPWTGSFVSDTLPTPVQALGAVACPTDVRCWAVGFTTAIDRTPATAAVVASSDGGRTWKVETIPATVGFLTDIACYSARACTVVGQTGGTGAASGVILTTQDAGATWALQTVPAGTSDVTAVSCRAGGRCMALANVSNRVTALTSAAVGAPWVTGGPLPATVSAGTGLSCPDAADCWASGTSPADAGHVSGVVVATADRGTTWALQTVPTGLGPLQDITCATAPASGAGTGASPSGKVTCTAVGTTTTAVVAARTGKGVVLTTSDGGITWVSAPVTDGSADLYAVSCDAGPCIAVGTTVAATAQEGIVLASGTSGTAGTPTTRSVGWRKAKVATVALPLSGAACRSLSSCVVVGESITAHLSVR
ncbi:MAG: hypothetical protein WCI26_02580 [Acidimicrobiales bacterium]